MKGIQIHCFLRKMEKVQFGHIFILLNIITFLSLSQLSVAIPSNTNNLAVADSDSPISTVLSSSSNGEGGVRRISQIPEGRKKLRRRTGRDDDTEQDDDDDGDQEQGKVTAAPASSGKNKTKVEETLEPVTIGNFRTYVHAIDSGDVIIIDEKTLEIPHFSYDGEGPASWFIVGKDGEYTREMVDLPDITVLPDENESCNSLRRYNQETITLTLPGKLTVYDIEYLSVYCLRFNHNFGYVTIPDDIKVPKAGKKTAKVEECEDVESSESNGNGGGAGRPRPAARPQAPPPQQGSRPGGGLLGGLLNILG